MAGRPREFDRGKALKQAMDLFWSQGYEATGVAELCDHMGVGRQSLYNTFGDKQALFVEALEHYRDVQIAPMIEVLSAPGSGLANVHQVLDMWQDGAGKQAKAGCLMANSIAEFGIREPKLSRRLRAMLCGVEDAFRAALERARDDGELPDAAEPRKLARLFATLAQGLATVGRLDPSGMFVRDAVESMRRLLQ